MSTKCSYVYSTYWLVSADWCCMSCRRTCDCDVCLQLCQLSRDGEAYHDYCLNYSKAMSYLEQLRKKEDFCEFEKVTTRIRY